MIAWSLSGGGNRGPIQVGAMRALFEAGIQPDMLVGTSAGALNAAFLATDPTPAGVEHLAQTWLKTTREDILPGNNLTRAVRVITGADSLNSGQALRAYIVKNIPPGVETFGDLKVKLYLTTADLQTGQLYLYGDDPTAHLADAAVSSAALPIIWPPVEVEGRQYVDGGIVANVPISIAVDKGADTIYALDLETFAPSPDVRGVFNIALRTFAVILHQQLLRDIERAIRFSEATLHYIYFGDILSGVQLGDFSHTAEMLERGYARTKEYLEHPTPNQLSQPVLAAAAATAICPPGAVSYNPER